MLGFKGYLIEQEETGGLTIFDIDDTLFHTTAKVLVKKDGKVIHSLDNQQFNDYKLKTGEEFDFGEFRSAKKFKEESRPIGKMMAKAKAALSTTFTFSSTATS